MWKNVTGAQSGLAEGSASVQPGVHLRGRDKEERKFNLENGIGELVHKINERLLQKGPPVVVAVGGRVCSGKSTEIASRLRYIFGDNSVVLSLDNYYRGISTLGVLPKIGDYINFDVPEWIDFDAFLGHLEQLKVGMQIVRPSYDFITCESGPGVMVQPANLIIVEGIFALRANVANHADIKVFVKTDTIGQMIRRLIRDAKRKNIAPVDTLKYFAAVTEPMQKLHIDQTASVADILIQNNYNPALESQRMIERKCQLKFRTSTEDSAIAAISADKIFEGAQHDEYFDSGGYLSLSNGESLRLRTDERGRRLLYNGPILNSDVLYQPRIDLVLPNLESVEIPDLVNGICGKKTLSIDKKRITYKVNDILLHIDREVKKTIDGTESALGDFVELEYAAGERYRDSVESIRQMLHLAEPVHIPYSDM